MKLPAEMQEVILSELPNVIEQIEDATKQIYDPNTIWLEAMQYADYVQQFAEHLQNHHGEDCIAEVAEELIRISSSFKVMGEGALKVIDESEEIHGA